MSTIENRQHGIQMKGRLWLTQKAIDLLHGEGSTMKSVADRTLELFDIEPGKEISASQLARDLHCSYSTARTALKKAHDRGELKRKQLANGEWYYWKARPRPTRVSNSFAAEKRA